jgi:hypothetical protein
MRNPFRYFNSSPEVIRLRAMMYARYPLSLRQVEDLLFERGIDICHELLRFWWNRFDPIFAAEIRKRRILRWSGLFGQLWLSAKLESCGCRLGVCGQRGSVVQASPEAKRRIHRAGGPAKNMSRSRVA